MWMINRENKGKRILASLIAFCMVLQLFGWNLGSFQLLAAEKTDEPLQKVITVSEKEILRAALAEEDQEVEIDETILPYIGDQKEIAKDHLESILSQSVIIKQKSLGSKCAAIIAIETEDPDEIEPDDDQGALEEEEGFQYERILMIGLNGNSRRDCEFTLEITNAEGIVVKELKVTGYRQDRLLASDSNATATDSNAQPTGSNAIEMKSTEETVKVQTGSDADDSEEDDRSYLFVEDYSESYDEGIAGLLVSKKQDSGIALLSFLAGEEENDDSAGDKDGQKDLETPKMTVAAGGFGVASLLKTADLNDIASNLARVSLSADSKNWDEESSRFRVESGDAFTINASATYSAVSSSNIKKAYFTVDFQLDDQAKDLIRGPETDPDAEPVDSLDGEWREEWEEIEGLLGDAGDDWQLITVESISYFYSAKEMKAVFSLQGKNGQGASISGVPFRFRFPNGLTPDGTELTAVPGVLNQEELEKDYSNQNHGAGADGQIIIGSDLDFVCDADFAWTNVKISQSGGLGNLYGNSDSSSIIYAISTSPDYADNKNLGIMYTKAYTVTDKMYFENFYIDGTDCHMAYYPARPGEFALEKGSNKYKLIGLDLPSSAMTNGVAKPIYAAEDSNKIIGIEIQYTVGNNTLAGDIPSDLAVKTTSGNNKAQVWLHYGSFKGTGMLKFEGDELPKVTNHVYFDAYSIMHDGEEYPGIESETIEADKAHHHSHAQIASTATESHEIEKKAYRESTCSTEAVGENQVFGPEEKVYYQIKVTNKEYQTGSFRVEDQIPDGLKPESVSLVSLKVGNTSKKDEMVEIAHPKTERKEEGKTLFWDGIQIPAGQSAVLVLEGTIKSKEELSKVTASSYLLKNTATWYESGKNNRLGLSEAIVYAKLNELSAGEVKFGKARTGSTGDLAIGSDVTYTLTAKLTDATVAPQRLTITDHWPEQLTLKNVSKIPAGAIVTLKAGDEVIASYTNTGTGNSTAAVPGSFKTPQNKTMTAADAARIKDVEINVFVDGNTAKAIDLTGNVTEGGEIVNNADTSAGNQSGPVTVTALAMKIEKKAYRIPAEDRNKITDANSLSQPVNEKVTFSENDVICYEVAVTNTGTAGQSPIEPVITDDISNLFKLGTVPDLAAAVLDGKTGSVFVRKEAKEGNVEKWEPLQVTGGKISLNLKGAALKPGDTEWIRIYVTVPGGAVGNSPQTFKNEARSILTINNKQYPVTASATVTTLKNDEQSASINKEVIAVARDLTTDGGLKLVNAKWKDKELFGGGSGLDAGLEQFTVGAGDYVFYRMEIHNDSETAIKLYEIQDWLPEGMKFSRFFTFNPQQKTEKNSGKWGSDGTGDTLKLGSNANWGPTLPSNDKQNWLFYDDATGSKLGVDYDATVKHTSPYMKIIDTTTYRARTYGEENVNDSSNKLAVVQPGKTMVFGIIAQVTGTGLISGDLLTNTAGFITDSTVTKEAGVKNCEEQSEIKDLTGMADKNGNPVSVGGKSYLSGEYKAFTSSATVIYSDYTPGIEKELSQFFLTGQWNDYDPDSLTQNFAPTDWMRWNIKLSNGMYGHATAGAIEEYTVSDTLPLGLGYNTEDKDGNYFILTNKDKVILPEPLETTNEEGKIVVSWEVKKTASGYVIEGADGKTTETTKNLSIPARGSIDLQISTKRADSVSSLRYGTYENRSDLVPAAAYPYNDSCAGKIEGAKEDRTIYATARVNIFGSGRTESWKEISGTYDGNYKKADGRNSENYIFSDAGGTVTYSLHVQNPSSSELKNLVIMDHLPDVGDNGLVNNSKRYSDFTVKFAEEMNLQVSVGDEKLDAGQYDVYYGTWNELAADGSALSDAQWRLTNHNGWQKSCEEDSDSIRIEITDPKVLELLKDQKDGRAEESLTVVFDAVVPEADELKNLDTAIAWNTFGYSYEIGGQVGDGTFLTVEPAKVGVKIPTAQLSVKKEVESQIAGDGTRQFTFVLERKEKGKFLGSLTDHWVPVEGQRYVIGDQTYYTGPENGTTTESGKSLGAGEFLLAKDQQAVFTVTANYEYRVRELDTDGFTVKATAFTTDAGGTSEKYDGKNPPAILTQVGEKYFCTFTNIKDSMILPETGGMGTRGFRTAGISIMMLAFLLLAGYWMSIYSKILKKRRMGMI